MRIKFSQVECNERWGLELDFHWRSYRTWHANQSGSEWHKECDWEISGIRLSFLATIEANFSAKRRERERERERERAFACCKYKWQCFDYYSPLWRALNRENQPHEYNNNDKKKARNMALCLHSFLSSSSFHVISSQYISQLGPGITHTQDW